MNQEQDQPLTPLQDAHRMVTDLARRMFAKRRRSNYEEGFLDGLNNALCLMELKNMGEQRRKR